MQGLGLGLGAGDFHGSEFVPLKAHCELRRSAPQYPANSNEL
jgi:hypothetical protein